MRHPGSVTLTARDRSATVRLRNRLRRDPAGSMREEFIFLASLVALAAGIVLVVVALSEVEPSRAFPLAFVIGGSLVVVGGFLNAIETTLWFRRAASDGSRSP